MQITIDLPENVYQAFTQIAQRKRLRLEDIITEKLQNAFPNEDNQFSKTIFDWSSDEIKVIEQINEFVFPNQKQAKFDKLVEKRRAEKISPDELDELITLTGEADDLNLKRLELLAKLAKSKNQTLREIAQMLEVKPVHSK